MTTAMTWVEFGFGFGGALLFGTLAEYIIHRLMHIGLVLRKVHAEHHQASLGQGWWGEFQDYFWPSVPILPVGFLYSIPAGIGFAIGGVFYAVWAAYAHQLQHENPELVFWMRIPIHHVHHHHKMWRHNFGISVSIWDHVFRTYKKVDWHPSKRPFQYPLSSFFGIQWF